ncbi:MAG: hypothetical protein ACXADY_16860 [Candidatus Hodarchaeales archaeon]
MVEEDNLGFPISISSGVHLKAITLATENGFLIYSQYFDTTQHDKDTVGSILLSILFFSSEVLSHTSLVERGLQKAKERGTDLIIQRGKRLIGIAVVDRSNQVIEQEDYTLINRLLNFIADVEDKCAQELADLNDSWERYNWLEARQSLRAKIDLVFRRFIGLHSQME